MFILLDQNPLYLYFKGSGFPIPENGLREISFNKALIRLNISYHFFASTDNPPKTHQQKYTSLL